MRSRILLLFLIVETFASNCPIYLTISPLSKNVEDSNLVINWGPGCENPPIWIKLYTHDPSTSNKPPTLVVETKRASFGNIETNVMLGKINLPDGWNKNETAIPKFTGPRCLPYYIASFNDKEMEVLECLKINPHWMSQRNDIGQTQLKNLFLPGTHCSGCYYNRTQRQNPSLKKFGITQNFDIWTQLVMGIRYLDISVSYEKNYVVKKFWISNGNIRIMPLENIFNDIRKFIYNTNEVIVMEFNEFPIGMYKHPERHYELIKYLNNELGDIVYRSNETNFALSYNITINDMRRAGKRLVLTYGQEQFARETDLLWYSWKKYSSEYLKSSEYSAYMSNLFSRRTNLTDTGRVLFGVQGFEASYDPKTEVKSTRERAIDINRQITNLIGGPWSSNVNAIAIDFFMSSHLIDIAIYTNLYKNFNGNDKINSEFDIITQQ